MSIIGNVNIGDTSSGLFIGTVNINNLDASSNAILYSSDGKKIKGANKISYNDTSGNLITSGTITGANINTTGNINASGSISCIGLNTNTGSISCVGLNANTGNISTSGTITGANINTTGNINASGSISCVGLNANTGNISTSGTISGGAISGDSLTINSIVHTNMAKYIDNDFSNSLPPSSGSSISFFSKNISGFTANKQCILFVELTFYTSYIGDFYGDFYVDNILKTRVISRTSFSMCHLYKSYIISFIPTATIHTLRFQITAIEGAAGIVSYGNSNSYSYVIYQHV